MARKVRLALELRDAERLEFYIHDAVNRIREKRGDGEMFHSELSCVENAERILGLLLLAKAAATGKVMR